MGYSFEAQGKHSRALTQIEDGADVERLSHKSPSSRQRRDRRERSDLSCATVSKARDCHVVRRLPDSSQRRDRKICELCGIANFYPGRTPPRNIQSGFALGTRSLIRQDILLKGNYRFFFLWRLARLRFLALCVLIFRRLRFLPLGIYPP